MPYTVHARRFGTYTVDARNHRDAVQITVKDHAITSTLATVTGPDAAAYAETYAHRSAAVGFSVDTRGRAREVSRYTA